LTAFRPSSFLGEAAAIFFTKSQGKRFLATAHTILSGLPPSESSAIGLHGCRFTFAELEIKAIIDCGMVAMLHNR
jgi:hypothetical protein